MHTPEHMQTLIKKSYHRHRTLRTSPSTEPRSQPKASQSQHQRKSLTDSKTRESKLWVGESVKSVSVRLNLSFPPEGFTVNMAQEITGVRERAGHSVRGAGLGHRRENQAGSHKLIGGWIEGDAPQTLTKHQG